MDSMLQASPQIEPRDKKRKAPMAAWKEIRGIYKQVLERFEM
jgi:hypothetical protein